MGCLFVFVSVSLLSTPEHLYTTDILKLPNPPTVYKDMIHFHRNI